MFKTYIKLLTNGNQYCIFNTDNYSLFDIDDFTFNVLIHYFAERDIEATSLKFDIDKQDLSSTLDRIGFREIPIENNTTEIQQNGKRTINRITLHLSNDCNLRCKYCYANGGDYGKKRGFMTLETARKFVDYCCENFTSVENIVFFGGEPFLNCKAMEYVCSYFTEKRDIGEISYLPKFGAITNGTISSKKALELIRKYYSFITVSVDGPKDINDVNRVFKNGNGTYDSISKFLNEISSFNNLRVRIEATFTKDHLNRGYSRKSIKEFFYNEYHLATDVIDEMSIDVNKERIAQLENPLDSPWFMTFLKSIVNKQIKTKCDILRNIFAISVEGDIYPCHMNVGDDMPSVASIWDSSDILGESLKDVSYQLKNNEECLNCWANKLCGYCSRVSFFDNEKKQYSHIPIKSQCEDFKEILSLSLLKICEVRKNPDLWDSLINSINSSSN